MIVDCYTCIWESSKQLGRAARPGNGRPNRQRARAGVDPPDHVGIDQHLAASKPVDAAIVLGFKSRHLDADVPNEFVSDYVRRHPDRLIGFAGIDPAESKKAIEDLRFAHGELAMRGVAFAPSAQNLHPCHTDAKSCYEIAEELRMPVIFHTGFRDSAASVLQYARPALLDEVAQEFPDLKIVIAHMGFPWVNETIALLAKHTNVHADISWLLHQPWQAYNALVNAHQYGVLDRLLFGSGFPYTSPAHTIEGLYGLNQMVSGTNLPTIPRDQLRGIVQRDALALLGLREASSTPAADDENELLDEEDEG